jgi:mannose/cellobiose epimerase-like protein (N-acyl-D-glucosamine 2-epimerase family)
MPSAALTAACDRLKAWLLREAYPLWWEQGYDHVRGGFEEKLDLNGLATGAPRRARVQPRQIFAYAVAGELGWDGPWREAVQSGLDWYQDHYFRRDGLIRTLVSPDGAPLDDSVVLYDQAFGLFALATAYAALDRPPGLLERADVLLLQLKSRLKHPVGGFEEADPRQLPLLSNPHMHLFEAALAWTEAGGGPQWRALADEIAELAVAKFIDPVGGGLREYFDGDWKPVAGIDGRIVEPGHQFEWAWLMLRWSQLAGRPEATRVALRMIAIGEGPGIDKARGVAMNQLLDDMSVHDPVARLWPQTERIKAHVLAGNDAAAVAGVDGLMKYFDTPTRGLWRDRMNPDGSFVEEPAPASSFYHIVCAILYLDRAVR